MKKIIPAYILFILLLSQSCSAQKSEHPNISEKEVARVLKTLSADDMRGRNALKPDEIGKAADFISDEFKKAGLAYFNDGDSYRQSFALSNVVTVGGSLKINGAEVSADHYLVSSDQEKVTLKNVPKLFKISKGDDFFAKYSEVAELKESVLVQVDESFKPSFKRPQNYLSRGNMSIGKTEIPTVIYVLSNTTINTLELNFANHVSTVSMFNIVGVLPGKSKPNEYVVFSGHYDHLGIIKAVGQDSIANGADDDASGTTAVIELAKYFAQKNDNERTLIFVAFTAEEIGGYGSQYFSKQLNPTEVVAMFNIEMIGKESKFGRNNAYITGYEHSDFGKILQKNLVGTDFKFYPDPYPKQNLFYRSDNATLARLGVPAHTISSVQIETDKLYHSVKDEFESLNVGNITEVIKAIAISSKSIVNGEDTPSRVVGIK
ncbi:M28 family metallopeptidase [Pedobacter arcticus]|uniref:M28 family metallopeptidase n=1 Tax=Pedobacter arcticus TaxID=752140 RepID=UPI00031B88DE|nr:M20/M25/M40 family metallo-hydrolase [Pedobacter arcticus]